MTGLELIFAMLGEEGTRIEAIKRDAQGFNENREAAIEGGKQLAMHWLLLKNVQVTRLSPATISNSR